MEISAVNIVASGSAGNCEIYFKRIAVDMGICFEKINPYIKDLQIVLTSHEHSDHLNMQTINKLAFERPTLRFAIGSHLKEHFACIKNVDVCEIGKVYDYGSFKISPVMLYHDCQNIGWRIFIKRQNGEYYKIFRATDTKTLSGIEAKGYDLYALEHSYDETIIHETIKSKKEKGEYAYETGVINSHLSEQQARDFIYRNKGENSHIIRLHEHSIF